MLVGAVQDRTADTNSVLTDKINYYGGFVQDNFRVSSKLTINAGLRLEHESGVMEQNNALLVGFNQSATNVLASCRPGLNLKARPNMPASTVLPPRLVITKTSR